MKVKRIQSGYMDIMEIQYVIDTSLYKYPKC